MKDDVFNFEDFLSNPKKSTDKVELIKENVKEEPIQEFEKVEDTFIFEKEEEIVEIVESVAENNYYKIYKDKSEDFSCDISIVGADQSDTEARLVVESEDWTLMFKGIIKNGKCTIPIKKLSILNEDQIGNIRLEVVAEGNLFIPWEDKFQVKLSKKVTVKVNEQKETVKKEEKKV